MAAAARNTKTKNLKMKIKEEERKKIVGFMCVDAILDIKQRNIIMGDKEKINKDKG
jgi:hypothetical protein